MKRTRATGKSRFRHRGGRFWADLVGACTSVLLFVVTLTTPDWIEAVFGVDPDHGSGRLELAVLGACLLSTLTLSLMARRDWLARGVIPETGTR